LFYSPVGSECPHAGTHLLNGFEKITR